jgi:hypothetical protein
VERLKVKALSSNPSTAKQNKTKNPCFIHCYLWLSTQGRNSAHMREKKEARDEYWRDQGSMFLPCPPHLLSKSGYPP